MTDPPIVCGVDGTWHHGIETVTRAGDAATELTEAGRERQPSLLVLGSRGRGSLRVALLGSVSAAATRLVSPENFGLPVRAAWATARAGSRRP
jgi:hypothetical protein